MYIVFNIIYNFTVSDPSASVILSSSIPNPIPPFGSSVTLTCAVELTLLSPSAVDVPITVNIVLTNPDGFMTTSTAQPFMLDITNYASTSTISSFGRRDSGLYTCSGRLTSANAYISNSSTVYHSVRVTTGEMFTDMFSYVLIVMLLV